MKPRRIISALVTIPCAIAITLIVTALQALSGIDWEPTDLNPWD
jgi:hypothetical protein